MRRLGLTLGLLLLAGVVGPQEVTVVRVGTPGPTGPAGATAATLIVASSTSHNAAAADYVCDGTNDEVEINAAIAALPAAGGHVILLEGTYDLRDPVTMRSGLWLSGEGAGTILKVNAAWDDAKNYVFYDGVAHAQTTQNNITISDLTFDGNLVNWGEGASHYIVPFIFWGFNAEAHDNRVERVVIRDAYGYGVLAIRNRSLHVRATTISNMGDSCVEIRSTRGAVMSDNSFSTCSLQTYADHVGSTATEGIIYTGNDMLNVGVYVADPATGEQVNGYTFTSNSWRIVGNVSVNVWFNATKNLTIADNIFDTTLSTYATPNPVIHLPAATVNDAHIRGNVMNLGTDTGGMVCRGGILIAGASNVTVAANDIRCPGTDIAYGVRATSGTNIVIRDNLLFGAGVSANRIAIDVAGTTGAVVERNRLDTWGTGVKVAVTAGSSRVADNWFSTVTTPYSLLDTTALFREQTGLAFLSLPADVADGSLVYCSDCTLASPCAAGGTGALAKRLANAWVCN